MAREIKFRAKRLDNGEWAYGDLHLRTPHAHIHSEVGSKAFIDTDTIGQFTGIKDTSDKEVYEGDILRVTSLYERNLGQQKIVEVMYDDKAGAFMAYMGAEVYLGIVECDHQIDIIGNIHDNPELLNNK